MEASFWHDRWANNHIAFHKLEANPVLIEHFNKLNLETGSRVFVPLCGKSLDIGWLLSQGYQVVGVELSEFAVRQLFTELDVPPQITQEEHHTHFKAPNLDIIVGNLFGVTQDHLGHIDAIYDRAALVALPKAMRTEYSKHLRSITKEAPQILVTFVYDQTLTNGPPFSVDDKEVEQHYSSSYHLDLLSATPIPGGLRGQYPAEDHVWIMKK